ncbi:AraC family transcriptional regulator [Streptomyces sp. NPDC085932]|uniref:AraC family transcriptional regulator n=1 Tax=Streptomyces sp. NPDC085932 TaxID=3365741 RepID=UPI0037D2A499
MSTRYVRNVVEIAAERGADPDCLLRSAGLKRGDLDGIERIGSSAVRRIWDLAIDATGDRGFGLHVGGRLPPGAYHILGHALLASPTLREAAHFTVRYHSLVSDAGGLSFTLQSDRAVLTYHRFDPPSEAGIQQTEAIFAGILTAARWLSSDGWKATHISFTHVAPACGTRLWETALAAPVTFEAEANRMEWTLPQVNAALPYGDPVLLDFFRTYADRMMAGSRSDLPVSHRAATWLSGQNLAAVSPDDLANALHLSGRSLRRALSQDGTSWRRLLDQARHRLAVQLVSHRGRTLKDVARQLGYSDATSLVRAFHRWEGMSPRRYAASAVALEAQTPLRAHAEAN